MSSDRGRARRPRVHRCRPEPGEARRGAGGDRARLLRAPDRGRADLRGVRVPERAGDEGPHRSSRVRAAGVAEPTTTSRNLSESGRIASPRFPERLAEIRRALSDDDRLVLECFVRPILADRWARLRFQDDERIHDAARASAERLRSRLLVGPDDGSGDLDAVPFVVDLRVDPTASRPEPTRRGPSRRGRWETSASSRAASSRTGGAKPRPSWARRDPSSRSPMHSWS
jgi:hypothetical protein